jgi:hypothetical protein
MSDAEIEWRSAISRAISDRLEQDTSRLEQANAKLPTLRSDLREAEKKLKSGEKSAMWWGDSSVFWTPWGYDLQADENNVSYIELKISNIKSEIAMLQTSIGNINAAMVAEENLDYRKAIDLFDQVGLGSEAKRIRKKMKDEGKVKVDQTVVHGDYVDDRDTIVKDSVINRSNVGGGSSKMQELEKLAEMKEKGLIDDDEFKQMKKEILGK